MGKKKGVFEKLFAFMCKFKSGNKTKDCGESSGEKSSVATSPPTTHPVERGGDLLSSVGDNGEEMGPLSEATIVPISHSSGNVFPTPRRRRQTSNSSFLPQKTPTESQIFGLLDVSAVARMVDSGPQEGSGMFMKPDVTCTVHVPADFESQCCFRNKSTVTRRTLSGRNPPTSSPPVARNHIEASHALKQTSPVSVARIPVAKPPLTQNNPKLSRITPENGLHSSKHLSKTILNSSLEQNQFSVADLALDDKRSAALDSSKSPKKFSRYIKNNSNSINRRRAVSPCASAVSSCHNSPSITTVCNKTQDSLANLFKRPTLPSEDEAKLLDNGSKPRLVSSRTCVSTVRSSPINILARVSCEPCSSVVSTDVPAKSRAQRDEGSSLRKTANVPFSDNASDLITRSPQTASVPRRIVVRGHPPRPVGIIDKRGDAFLEPYMQGLGPDFTSPHHHLSGKTPEGGSVTSSPAGDVPNNHNTKTTLADLSAPFRLLELDGSADSLDQEQDSSLSSGSGSSGDAPCDIGLVERLIRSHPVWFLPGIQRAGAFHLLQSKEEGNFVVRQSSQPNTMAISVRLPAGKGPYIEHYLIQAVDGQLSLESSDNRFDNIPQLIAHYSQCCDELPVQLSLPRAMREAKNRQQLSSLALLGQEFWRYPMANPRPPERSQVGVEMTTLQQSPPSSGSSLSSLGSGNNNHLNSSSTNTGAQTPTSELGGDAIVLNLTPLYSVEPLQTPSVLTTFKGSDITANNTSPTVMSSATIVVTSSSTATNVCTASVSRGPRPTPPNTLNLVCSASSQTATLSAGVRSSNSSPAQQVTSPPSCNGDGGSSRSGPLVVSGGGKTPPPPPPRWAKPTALSSGGQNFTVTTTVTFSVNNTTPPPHVEVSCVQVAPKQSQIEDGHLTTSSHGSTLEQRSMRLHQVVSPSTPTETTKLPANNRVKKHRPNHLRQSSVKESHHYQESDILDSPTVYYRSSVADKFSDYEDIWGPEMLSTFKPTNQIPRSSPFSSPEDISSSSGISKRTPDLLERIGTPVSGSCVSLNSGSNNLKEQKNRLGLVINTNTCNSNSHSPLSPPSDGKSDEHGPSASNHTKQGSPFYAEPADALKQSSVIARRRPRVVQSAFPHHQSRNHRHSDPAFFQQWPASTSYHAGGLERIDSTEELPLSSSVDNLALLKNSRNITATQTSGGNKPKGKPVQPPRVRPSHGAGKSFNDTSWAVDSSWEFIGNEDEGVDVEGGEERERRFPSLEQQETSLEEGEVGDNGQRRVTVQELIAQRFPELLLSPDTVSTVISPNRGPSDIDSSGFSSRMSSYDNVEGRNLHHDSNHHHLNVHNAHPCGSHISDDDTQTIFSEPWDSSRWENLLHMESSESVSNSAAQESSAERLLVPEGNALCDAPSNQSIVSQVKRSKSFKERLDPLLSPPRLQALRSRELNGTGASIRAYALHLSADKSTTFAQNIDNFIACTRESRETSPQVVMRNMRQFMSGMKNYLVKHGEREFEKEVEKERVKLKANEFLNLDAILEGVMHKLVVRPLREHLYQLFVDEYTRSGAIQLLADNMRYARTKPAHELGIRPEILAPSGAALETICYYLTRLQEVDSPLEKLENLLTCISAIFNSVKSCNQGRGIALGADDFLPLFVWVLVQSGMMAAEIEAEYMWGLLHPSLLSGEGGYYLTTLSSAVHVLKNFRACSEEQSRAHGAGMGVDVRVGLLADFRSVLKIVVPDEVHGSIITKTLPVRPNMTTRDVCKIIAHKVRITNPQDYGLFKLVDGEETLLNDGECPQDIKGIVSQVGKHCMFAYKRIDAKIAWPTTSSSS